MKGESTCMITGSSDAKSIKNSHLWPDHTKGKGLSFFDLEPEALIHPRNFLRLHCTIERAFDQCQITLVPEWNTTPSLSTRFRLRVHVLDPELKAQTVPMKGFTALKWSDLDERVSHWEFGRKPNQAPYTRLLAQHQFTSLKRAAEKGWIGSSDLTEMQDRALRVLRYSLGEAAEMLSSS